jgi:dTDP-4-amino-4,6-dideoxygalactose transaminase
VNRGRTAIEFALRAIGLGESDDVVLPSYVCRTVLDAILRAGARPVFADVGPDLHVTPESVKAAITVQTKCVIVPHLFGNTAPIDEIETMLKGTGIALIDDAAQSFGSRCSRRLIGTFGDCGIISCGPGKALAGPAGGLLITNSPELYDRAAVMSLGRESATAVARRVLSFWIWRRFRKYMLPFQIILDRILGPTEEPPYTACTMSNLDGAIALQQFHAFRQNDQTRRHNANVLLQALGTVANYSISDFSHDGMLIKLVIVLSAEGPTADKLIRLLANAGIECQRGYLPLHQEMKTAPAFLPSTEALWDRVVCIPVDMKYKKLKRLLSLAEKWPGI